MGEIEKVIDVEDPDLSVVVPTIPSRETQCLPALADQTHDSYQVIVVSDASLDVCQARNAGIERADSDRIALTDDDTIPPTDWVETAVSHLTAKTVLLEGPIRIRTDEDDLKFRERFRSYVGCNLAFTKSAWQEVGGFQSSRAGWSDDISFGWEIERRYGLDRCEYSRSFCMTHLGLPKSELDMDLDRELRREFTSRYFQFYRNPPSLGGQVGSTLLHAVHVLSPALADRVHPYLVK